MSEILIKLPEDAAAEFTSAWEEHRIAVGAGEDHRLPPTEITEGFDTSAVAEWVIPILLLTPKILRAVATILVTSKGTVVIKGKTIRLENYSAGDAARLLETIRKD